MRAKKRTARARTQKPRRKSTAALRETVTQAKRAAALRKQARLGRIRRAMRYEIGNLITHAAGMGLAICGVIFLLAKSAASANIVRVRSYAVYGACIIVLYASSTIYHALWDARSKKVLRRLDHSAIYMAIAGTLTPVAMLTVGGAFGVTMVALIWVFALAGISLKIFFPHKYAKASVTAYIIMGWVGIAAIKPVYIALPAPALFLLLAGGLSYTLGTVFYARKRMPYNHMIWHFFVLGGSVCHFLALYLYV